MLSWKKRLAKITIYNINTWIIISELFLITHCLWFFYFHCKLSISDLFLKLLESVCFGFFIKSPIKHRFCYTFNIGLCHWDKLSNQIWFLWVRSVIWVLITKIEFDLMNSLKLILLNNTSPVTVLYDRMNPISLLKFIEFSSNFRFDWILFDIVLLIILFIFLTEFSFQKIWQVVLNFY